MTQNSPSRLVVPPLSWFFFPPPFSPCSARKQWQPHAERRKRRCFSAILCSSSTSRKVPTLRGPEAGFHSRSRRPKPKSQIDQLQSQYYTVLYTTADHLMTVQKSCRWGSHFVCVYYNIICCRSQAQQTQIWMRRRRQQAVTTFLLIFFVCLQQQYIVRQERSLQHTVSSHYLSSFLCSIIYYIYTLYVPIIILVVLMYIYTTFISSFPSTYYISVVLVVCHHHHHIMDRRTNSSGIIMNLLFILSKQSRKIIEDATCVYGNLVSSQMLLQLLLRQ